MPVNTKAIKRRIKSVGSTKKITKAMEMISAVKMRKAIEAAVNTRTYATLAWDLLVKLAEVKRRFAIIGSASSEKDFGYFDYI